MRSEKNFVVHQTSPVALSDLFIASLTQLGCMVIFFGDMCNANWLFKSAGLDTFRPTHHLRCQNSPMMLTPCSQCSTVLLIRYFTVSEWRQRSSAPCRARCRQTSDEKARVSLWWREHIKTNAKLRVSIRTDRKQLLSLYEGPRQILQCTVDHFESFDQCAEVLIGIAQRYAAGHLEADDLQRERETPGWLRVGSPRRHAARSLLPTRCIAHLNRNARPKTVAWTCATG